MIIRNRAPHARRRPSLAAFAAAQADYWATLRGEYRAWPVHKSPAARMAWQTRMAHRAAVLESVLIIGRAVLVGALAALGLACAVGLIGGAL